MRHAIVAAFVVIGCGAPARSTVPSDPLGTVTGQQLYERGLAHERSGDLIRAEQYLAAAVDRGVPDELAIDALLRVCLRSSRYGAALKHAERFLERHPEDWRMRYLVATLNVAVGRARAAVRELERLTHDRPDDAEPHLALAKIYEGAGDNAGAARHYRAFLARDGSGFDAAVARAWLRRWEQRRDRRRR